MPPGHKSPGKRETFIVRSILLLLLALIVGSQIFLFLDDPWTAVRKKEAQIMSALLAQGIEQFYADQSRLLLPVGQVAGKADLDSDTSPPNGLIRVLIGKEPGREGKQNPRDRDFLEKIKAAKAIAKNGLPANRPPWANGLVSENGEYAVVDAWGNFYRVRLDGDGNHRVANPDPDQAASGRPTLPLRVIVWSPGKDGYEETWEDNPKSWE